MTDLGQALDHMLTLDAVALKTLSSLAGILGDLIVVAADLAIAAEDLTTADRALALGRQLMVVLESASMVIGGQGISDLPEV